MGANKLRGFGRANNFKALVSLKPQDSHFVSPIEFSRQLNALYGRRRSLMAHGPAQATAWELLVALVAGGGPATAATLGATTAMAPELAERWLRSLVADGLAVEVCRQGASEFEATENAGIIIQSIISAPGS